MASILSSRPRLKIELYRNIVCPSSFLIENVDAILGRVEATSLVTYTLIFRRAPDWTIFFSSAKSQS